MNQEKIPFKIQKYFPKPYTLNPIPSSRGFTLIELMIVFSVTVILSTIGIASFVTYSQIQSVNAARNDVLSMLYTARSRALSQVKPNSGVCAPGGATLDGYKVSINTNNTYVLYVQCNGSISSILQGNLPNSNITFSSLPASITFYFHVLTGTVDNAQAGGTTVSITGYGTTKTITLYQDGRIISN